MQLAEFTAKYSGVYLEIDANAAPEVRYQCMDLFYFYQLDVLGFTSLFRAGTAYQAFAKGHPEFEKIAYKPGMVPQVGDVIFWSDTYVKGTGHVAVFLEGNDKQFLSFDQNWPVGSNCHKQSHSYTGVVGWLRPKKQQPINNNKKRMIHLMNNTECVWTKDKSKATATYYILTADKKRRKVKSSSAVAVASLYGSYGKLRRVEWPHIAGLDKGATFDMHDIAITHPERFEAI